MRLVIQRVRSASVAIGGETFSEIGQGLLVLVGVEVGDTEEDMKWLAGHNLAVPLYEKYCEVVSAALGKPACRGVFGADMQVSLLNDGPVTIIMDSRMKE